MYIEILMDTEGSIITRKAQGDLDISCPFCRKKSRYLFNSDSNLFCRSCGKLLVKQLESSTAFTEEEIDDYIKVLTYGGGVLDRMEAALNLGKYTGTARSKVNIATLLSKVANMDPDYKVRENAKKALQDMAASVERERSGKNVLEPHIPKSPGKQTREGHKVVQKKPETKMEDELLSLLSEEVPDERESRFRGDMSKKSPYSTSKMSRKDLDANISRQSSSVLKDDLLSLLDEEDEEDDFYKKKVPENIQKRSAPPAESIYRTIKMKRAELEKEITVRTGHKSDLEDDLLSLLDQNNQTARERKPEKNKPLQESRSPNIKPSNSEKSAKVFSIKTDRDREKNTYNNSSGSLEDNLFSSESRKEIEKRTDKKQSSSHKPPVIPEALRRQREEKFKPQKRNETRDLGDDLLSLLDDL